MTAAPEPKRKWWQVIYPGIRTRVTLPFLLVIIVVAGIGVYIVTRLVAGSIQERFANQLVESARAATNAIVDIERQQLATLRAMAFTDGVADALSGLDSATLETLLRPIAANADVDDVIVFDLAGQSVLQITLTRAGETDRPASLPDVSQWAGTGRVLAGESDELGDKFYDLIGDPPEQILYISAPVINDSGRLAGGIAVGTDVQNMAERVTQQALSGVAFYDGDGVLLASTFPGVDRAYLQLEPDRAADLLQAAQTALPVEALEFDAMPYQVLYSPLQFRSQPAGILAVGLPSNFIVERSAASRDLFGVLFAGLFVTVGALGLLTARTITNPVTWLVNTTRAIRGGDLSRRVGIRTPDELGELAISFDHMTDQLVGLNAEISALYYQQLAETIQRDAVLTSIADAVIVQDSEGKTILQNSAAESLITYIRSDPHLQEEFSAVRRSPDRLSTATTIQFGERYYSVLAQPAQFPSGELLGHVLVFHDITAIVQAEQLKDDLILQLSHELRTPLSAARGYVDLIQMVERTNLSERGSSFISSAVDSLMTLERIVNQVIDVSAIMSEQFTIDADDVDLADVLASLVDEWQAEVARREHQLVFSPHQRRILLKADERRLRQVFDHLIRNAYNYTLPGGHIEVTADIDGDLAVVRVIDNGVGIAEDEIDKVFERLYRGRSADAGPTDSRGLGLGLYFAQRIVQAHQGIMAIESKVDSGTVVTIKLPLLSTSISGEFACEPEEAQLRELP
jgi:signal transduction histidine kinase